MGKLALRTMRGFGLFFLARALSANLGRIIMYHNFAGPGSTDPDSLNVEGIRAQFEYLRKHFRVVPLLTMAEQLSARRELDPKMVALTIDDGRRNCYEFLFPLLKEFEFPATFFVVSSFIRGEDWIWTDKLTWLNSQTSSSDRLTSSTLEITFRALNRVRPEERNLQIEAKAKSYGLSLPAAPPEKYAPCSWSELREMADSGLMEIGSHTATHPIMSSITDEESWQELTVSRNQIADAMGREIKSFCFPNGMPGDFRPSQVKQVGEAGYVCSVVAQLGMVKSGSDPYQMKRIGMARRRNILDIAKSLDGVAYYQRRLARYAQGKLK
jgi:peptidoglycan/xylan/chitin deacetylase (PgdA/CDA1 family)